MALIFFCYGKRPFAERDEELGALREGWRKSRELDGKSGPHVDDRSRGSSCPEGLERVEELQVVISLESLSHREAVHCSAVNGCFIMC